jgi:hypothetical protein
LFSGVIFSGDTPDFQIAASRFGPQTRRRHAAIGEFERGSDAKPQ